jgi:hypothetical protein
MILAYGGTAEQGQTTEKYENFGLWKSVNSGKEVCS